MHEGAVPPNWRNIVKNSSFSSTDEQFSLADVWLQEHSLGLDDPDLAPALPSVTSHVILPSKGALCTISLVSKGASLPSSLPTVSEGA